MSKQGKPESQPRLLVERRFLPFFITQFLGAFNDNVFKNALLLLIAFHSAERFSLSSDTLINLSAGLWLLKHNIIFRNIRCVFRPLYFGVQLQFSQ